MSSLPHACEREGIPLSDGDVQPFYRHVCAELDGIGKTIYYNIDSGAQGF